MKKKTATRKGVVPQGDARPRVSTADRHALFVDAYMADMNATKAAIAAHYSEKTAYSAGHRLLRHVEVQRAIEAKRKELATARGITREKILDEMAKIAFSDPRAMFDEDGHLIPIHKLSDAAAGAIASIEVDTVRVSKVGEGESASKVITFATKVKCWDKGKQLENLLKHLGMEGDTPKVPEGAGFSFEVLKARVEKFMVTA